MLFRSLAVASTLLAAASQVHAHAGISPALGVTGTFVRADVTRPSTATPCGNGKLTAIDSSTAVAANNGLVALTVTNFNAGQDGSTQITSAKVDTTGTGKSFTGTATVVKNGVKAPTTVGSVAISIQMPAGAKCTGGTTKNKCLVSLTTAGGFGNCVVVTTGGTTAATNVATTGTAGTGATAAKTGKAGKTAKNAVKNATTSNAKKVKAAPPAPLAAVNATAPPTPPAALNATAPPPPAALNATAPPPPGNATAPPAPADAKAAPPTPPAALNATAPPPPPATLNVTAPPPPAALNATAPPAPGNATAPPAPAKAKAKGKGKAKGAAKGPAANVADPAHAQHPKPPRAHSRDFLTKLWDEDEE